MAALVSFPFEDYHRAMPLKTLVYCLLLLLLHQQAVALSMDVSTAGGSGGIEALKTIVGTQEVNRECHGAEYEAFAVDSNAPDQSCEDCQCQLSCSSALLGNCMGVASHLPAARIASMPRACSH